MSDDKLVERINFLRTLTVADIERDGEASSAMVHAGLLLKIIDRALQSERASMEGEIEEALALAKSVRRMVRAENVHARSIAKFGQDDTPTSRDDVDMRHADLYEEWPAKRLDALVAALTSSKTGDE